MSNKICSIREIHEQASERLNQNIHIQGWAKTIRAQKTLAFISLSDGTCFTPLQLVVEADAVDNFDEIARQGTATAFEAEGTLIATPQAKQPYEVKVTRIRVVGECPPEYPLQPKRHTPEYLRSIPHLRPRTNLFQAAFRVRSEAAFALHEFFHNEGFLYVHTPLFTGIDAEGAGEMFQVTTLPMNQVPMQEGQVDYSQDFFNKAMYLTVTGQLHVEPFAQAFSKTYTFGPTFRAEHSNTPRHAAEFWHIEPEIAFADMNDVMDLAERMLKFVVGKILERCSAEMDFFAAFVDSEVKARLQRLLEKDFARVTYTDAIALLEKANDKFQYPVHWGSDIQTEHERYLSEVVYEGPVFVTDYPKDNKSFYMRVNDDNKTVAGADLLVPGVGELIGGSQREERTDKLLEMMKLKGLNAENYEWYTDLRRYGSTPHGGFGLGFERLLMYVTGISNIRDVLPFPRTDGSAMY